jgi:lipid II:glycine glycyltransferase (peptidoglycan interpeptide bridge formation enzyme)
LSFFKDDLILTKNRQIQQTIILDLNKSEEDILTVMHSKTRYNIRLAEKKGVEIKLEKNVDIFWKLNSETIKRDRFKSHAKEYYEEMLTLDNVYQLIAYHEGEPIAANILIYFGDTLTYLHGTSASKKRNLMAPYLLQWEGIKLAKKLDCNFYDFWGVAPKAENTEKIQTSCFHNFCWPINHALSGVTRFKAGFGGQYVEYSQAFDIITKPWKYKIYILIRKLRGLK